MLLLVVYSDTFRMIMNFCVCRNVLKSFGTDVMTRLGYLETFQQWFLPLKSVRILYFSHHLSQKIIIIKKTYLK